MAANQNNEFEATFVLDICKASEETLLETFFSKSFRLKFKGQNTIYVFFEEALLVNTIKKINGLMQRERGWQILAIRSRKELMKCKPQTFYYG